MSAAPSKRAGGASLPHAGSADGAGAIRLISAGAGTGKTHRLVGELEMAITRPENPVRPEAVIATTFTVKAAAELRERVRSRLLEKGEVEAAQRLAAARLGTVNSVCGQLVTEFAFDLGLSPETQVLDETAANRAFERALSALVTKGRGEDDGGGDVGAEATNEAGAALIELTERMPGLDWLRAVRTVADRARENGLEPGEVRACAGRSIASLLRYFDADEGDAAAIERELRDALEAFLEGPLDSTKTTAGVAAQARAVLARLKGGRAPSWWDWAKLVNAEPGAKSRDLFEPLRAAARRHVSHPQLRADISDCIAHVFELAAQAIESYERHKREWGVMDFLDQEVHALHLLGRPDVQEMLREQIDLVLVDEFQDTSPLQLAVFLALAKLARESVWVGDQKQAIYGFRGTDPALMDAAIEAIVSRGGDGALETLGHSWRSRAELVRLTSDVFAAAFAEHGIPAERVRLEPAEPIAATADTLGPVIEAWAFAGTTRKEDDADALAAAVGELLDDPAVHVRDPLDNQPRRVQKRDIAVLCRSSESCRRAARALAAAGIAVVRPRAGLVGTPEARAVLAALRLWVDPRESLAAAELGRLLVHPDDPDAWLAEVLSRPGEAYGDSDAAGAIAAARERQPLAGPIGAFDAVLDVAGLRELCLRWGDSVQRLANLDALREFTHKYVAECAAEGMAATVAGLVAYLRGLEEDEVDEQATPSDADAVTVSTMHGAKGLEWPVVVLHDIDTRHGGDAFGVHFASERERFDFDDPLGGRWIRYWPDPAASGGMYPSPGKSELNEKVMQGPEWAEVDRRERREALRLLYVAWTRARDRLVLVGRQGKIVGSALAQLATSRGGPLLEEPAERCKWAGHSVEPRIRTVAPRAASPVTPEPGGGYVAAGPREYPPAWVEPSRISGVGVLGEMVAVGDAISALPPLSWTSLGSAVHAFFNADRPELDGSERLGIARSALEAYGVQGALQAEGLLRASDALHAWVDRRWPGAAWNREWPVRRRFDDGSELVGYADLVLTNDAGFVVVDHKCLDAPTDDALASAAAGYGGQLRAYAETIALATGKRALGCWVNAVLQGRVVEIGTNPG